LGIVHDAHIVSLQQVEFVLLGPHHMRLIIDLALAIGLDRPEPDRALHG